MKCEKCGRCEANFYYKETINGETTERRLCADCAREEGLDRAFDRDFFGGFDELFAGFFGDPFGGFALPRRSARTLGLPWVFALPRIEIGLISPEAPEAPAEAKAAEAKAPAEPDEALARRREINALRQQMEEAAKAEDYEKAIQLRDRLRELEK